MNLKKSIILRMFIFNLVAKYSFFIKIECAILYETPHSIFRDALMKLLFVVKR